MQAVPVALGYGRPMTKEQEMHPMLREMIAEPVGWMTIIGGLIILGLPVYVAWFVRKKIKEDEAKSRSK